MPGLFSTPNPPKELTVTVEAREVVRDLFEVPHLLVRLTITGPYFPHRAEEPFVAVGRVRSKFVNISEDGLRADAYFDKPLPKAGRVVFGHRDTIELIVPGRLQAADVVRLDHKRLLRAMPDITIDPRLSPDD